MNSKFWIPGALALCMTAPAFAAGNVTAVVDVTRGELRITGDGLDNDVEVTGSNGSFTVTGRNGTTVNLLPSALVENVRAIRADMGSGNDRVEFTQTAVRSHVRVRLDDGGDTVVFTGVRINGRTTVRGGQGNDRVVSTGGSVFKSFSVRGEGDNDDVVVDASAFRNRVRVLTHVGNDTVRFANCDFGGNALLEVLTSDGADDLELDDCTFDNDVEANMGDDDDHVRLADNDFNDEVHVNGGGGSDDDLDISGNDHRRIPSFRSFEE